MFISLKESDPMYGEYAETLYLLAAMINNHMFMEFRGMPEIERQAEISRLRERLEEMSH